MGILDRTHLRFFTRASARRLLEETGYRILEVKPVCSDRNPVGLRAVRDDVSPSRAGALLAGRLPGLFATQFLFRAAPSGAASGPGG